MTREEAIYRLKNTAWLGSDDDREETEEAVVMAIEALNSVTDSENDAVGTENDVIDLISRQDAMGAVQDHFNADGFKGYDDGQKMMDRINALPSAEPEEVIPHRNYKYLSDYWCECGWHLGKKGEVKYCARCGRKVNWDE